MTVALDDVLSGTEVSHDGLEVRPAGWGARAGAFCIDVLFAFGAALSLLLIGWSAPRGGAVSWVCLVLAALVVVAIGVNRLVAPAITGWSLGRSVFGIAVVDRDGLRPGPWRLLARDAAHLLDTLPLFLGWLWPLIDDRGRTFADLLSHTEVREVDGPRRDLRRLAGTVAAITAALAVLAAGLGYLGVYRPQQAGAEARVEIEDRGPKIVVDMLSYTKDSVDEDFARAQSLVTDGYRPEVIKQQTAVRETGPVDNDYWVSNSAVLSATADRATMLMLLQVGQEAGFLHAAGSHARLPRRPMARSPKGRLAPRQHCQAHKRNVRRTRCCGALARMLWVARARGLRGRPRRPMVHWGRVLVGVAVARLAVSMISRCARDDERASACVGHHGPTVGPLFTTPPPLVITPPGS